MPQFELGVTAIFRNVINAISGNLSVLLKVSLLLLGLNAALSACGLLVLGDGATGFLSAIEKVDPAELTEDTIRGLLGEFFTAGQAGIIIALILLGTLITLIALDSLTVMLGAQASGKPVRAPGAAFQLVKSRVFALMGLALMTMFVKAVVNSILEGAIGGIGNPAVQQVISLIISAILATFLTSATAAMYLEQMTPFQALGRSFRLGVSGFTAVFRFWLALMIASMAAAMLMLLLLGVVGASVGYILAGLLIAITSLMLVPACNAVIWITLSQHHDDTPDKTIH
ncbi:MAG: hypothetical protein Alpg2KO_15190 [Alphaproteobacteria bacterium]